MLTIILSAVLSAEPAAAVSVGMYGLNAINLDPKVVQFYEEHLAQHLGYSGVRVTTQKEMAAVLGLERQKQLLGCSGDEAVSCAAELAGALGADGLLMGDIAKHAGGFQMNLKVVSAGGSGQLASYSARTEDEEAVLGLLTLGAESLARELYAKLSRGEAPKPVAATVVARGGAIRRFSWAPAAVGAVLLGVGVVLAVLADAEWSRLHPMGTISVAEGNRAAAAGKSYQLWGGVLLSAGVACLVAAGAMFLFGGESAKVTAMVGPDGGGLAVSGVLP